MNRRDVIRGLSSTAALFGLPAAAALDAVRQLPDNALYESDPEVFWNQLRDEQFVLPASRVFLNNGSLGVAPRPVLRAVTDYFASAAALTTPEHYPRWGYESLDEYRLQLSSVFGCKKDELALVHNTTEAMSIIAGGMPLDRGDEVLITDQEHPSGKAPWHLRQTKGEITVREVSIPTRPDSPEQLLETIISAIGPKTRVLSFSGITSPTGLILPVREICDAAREKGVISVVDGAHMIGQIGFRIDELHCDYFASSPHKWLFAPAGSGILYINEERLDEHYPVIVTRGWDDKKLKAARFMRLGTNNVAILVGLMAGMMFARDIGSDRIHQRMHDLSKQVYTRARALPFVSMYTPDDDRMYAAMVTFHIRLSDAKLAKFWALCEERSIFTTRYPHLRVSTHIHTRQTDLDVFFDTLQAAAR